ncbi:MAG: phasin family protein [Candidatus Marinimicrobia bacterium]|jgi:polyhydroxyalkanoate synthesis regulator phasin|nr:phasin family protein [Candidatus Neomarinimicrobiota bacterium]MCK9560104.1 phasin family protein [Candidatus Neomarinimicrobiota bacterium]
MNELIKKIFLAGVGAASLTKEKIENILEDLIKRGEIAREDKNSLLNEMLNSVERGQQETAKFIRKEIEKVLKALDIPSRSEFEELKKQVKSHPRRKAK